MFRNKLIGYCANRPVYYTEGKFYLIDSCYTSVNLNGWVINPRPHNILMAADHLDEIEKIFGRYISCSA